MALLDTAIQNVLIESLRDKAFNTPFFIQNEPFFDRMLVDTEGGRGMRIPIQKSMGGGQGGDFVTSLANAAVGGFVGDAFVPAPAVGFGHSKIDHTQEPYMLGAQSPATMAKVAMTNAMENAREELANLLLSSLGHGVRAVISSNTNPSGTQYKLVLTTITDASKFQQGQVGKSKANATSTSYDAGSFTVLGVNDIEGSLLVDAGSSGWTPTNNHVIGLSGDLDISSTTTGFPSVFQWVPPVTARTNGVVGDTFLGVVRDATNPVVAVSGWAFDGRNNTRFAAVIGASSRMATYKNGRPDTCYCNPIQLPVFAKEAQAQVRNDMPSRNGTANTGYSGFTITTAAGPVDVLASSHMPADQMLLTKADSWVYGTPRGRSLFNPANPNALIVPDYSSNSSRISIMTTGFFGCENLAAAANILVDIPTT